MSYNQHYQIDVTEYDELIFAHIEPSQLRYIRRQDKRQSKRVAHNRKALRRMKAEQ